MTTPITDLCAALATHLAAQQEYVDLGLIETRFYDGAIIPYDVKTGRISDTALPAHAWKIVDAGRESIEGDRRHNGTSRRWLVTLENTFIYRASEGDATLSCAQVDAAMSVLSDCLDPRAKRQALVALMGGGEVHWSPVGGPQLGRSGADSGLARIWAWPYSITLSGVFAHI